MLPFLQPQETRVTSRSCIYSPGLPTGPSLLQWAFSGANEILCSLCPWKGQLCPAHLCRLGDLYNGRSNRHRHDVCGGPPEFVKRVTLDRIVVRGIKAEFTVSISKTGPW